MPRSYPSEVRRQVIELARAGTRVAQLSVTFGVTETTIYNWLKRERIDRGEEAGQTTDQQLELAAARRRIKQLETELAVSRKINEVFLKEGIAQKAVPGDLLPDRAGHQRPPCLPHARRLRVRATTQWKDRPDAPRTLRRIWLAGEIADVHKASGDLRRPAGHCRVAPRPRHHGRPQRGRADHARDRDQGPADPAAADGRKDRAGHLARPRAPFVAA